ncbi:ABC transporter ATP-binding protein [Kocuria sp. HSID16901]|uniref:ABC transporter ATP-binding protein n=1 Tax=Kocuria sp. HSID16901 TaxID=2419505 RepID=UPI00065F8BC5|nr:ABC transporter ATP-binding protein [Kocuria sp. HSID16901]RUQ21235.1 ABC transporter ATP-binding protein [Kocuria sp. HSID16901]
MRSRIVTMFIAAFAASLLDMVAVAAMLPLTQVIAAGDGLPGLISRYLVPILGTDDRKTILLALALGVGLAFLIKNAAIIVIRRWTIREIEYARSATEAEVLERYLDAPYARHRQRSKAGMLQILTRGIAQVFESVLLGYITIAVDGMTIVLILLTITVMSPVAALAAVVIFGGSAFLLARVLKPYSLKHAHSAYLRDMEAFGYLNPAIEGFRESRIFQREEYFAESFRKNRVEYAGYQSFLRVMGELPKYLLEVVMIFGILVVAILLFVIRDQNTAFGLLAVFAAAAMRVVPALNRVVATVNQVRAGAPSLADVAADIEELEADQASSSSRDEQIVEVPDEDIVVKDLTFSYSDSPRPVLKGVNVTIPRGHTVALVGTSGAGKTTFADILAGLYEPTGGTVTVGGVDISTHPRSWLSNVAMVSQKVYLWDASVRDLITFGEPRDMVDDAWLDEVVRQSQLEPLLRDLPDGLDSMVGDAGARLSGGQTQRIGIARALYRKPRVLILDEATSALDNETEHEITETIEALRGHMTVIVIAHRLSTVKNADEILFFARGQLQGRGSMSQLKDTEPEFARLVALGDLGV